MGVVKVKRLAETCKRGHSRWGYLPTKKTRYCLDCDNYRSMRRKYKKQGLMGRKAVVLMEQKVDFEISYLENQIAELVNQIVELRNEKTQIRGYYEKRIAERKRTK